MRKGMDDYTIAQWAGRTRIEDNAHYDHRTERERNEEIQALVPNEELNTLEKYRGGRPVTFMRGGDRPSGGDQDNALRPVWTQLGRSALPEATQVYGMQSAPLDQGRPHHARASQNT